MQSISVEQEEQQKTRTALRIQWRQDLLSTFFRYSILTVPAIFGRDHTTKIEGESDSDGEGTFLCNSSARDSSVSATMSVGEAACTYAALLLHDDKIGITAEKISTVLKAANVAVESYWPSLFARLAEKKNIEDLIMNVGSGGGGAPVAVAAPSGGAGGAAPAAAPAAEEKKEEPKEESDDDMGFSLFD
ncbi:hypothetical protein NE237_027374 [Protea cynaroides]|uniref:60S acidic ribosomal protein P1 n=1 Tax=Protea cynaroides TaxID=273540 RepID=A0A9Q0GME6_9MAGN|nr:hypothetical protein NE237_027374 [Protea cynaroides]